MELSGTKLSQVDTTYISSTLNATRATFAVLDFPQTVSSPKVRRFLVEGNTLQ